MKILVVNGTCRPAGTTAELVRAFEEGAQSGGAEVETILLRDCTIGYCTNCLVCYRHSGDGIAPCCQHDDMDGILDRIAEADGVLFASPVHNGFVTGPMVVFWERTSWRALRPGGPVLGMMSMASRLTGKVRAFSAIASAGGMPERLQRFCNAGNPWMKENAPLMLHGQWIGDLYAGADLERIPESPADWAGLYTLRRISDRQRAAARALGRRMTDAIRSGRLRAKTMERMVPQPLRWLFERFAAWRPLYRVSS